MPEERQPSRRFLSHVLVAAIFLAIGGIGGVMAKDRLPSPAPAAVAFTGEGDVRENSPQFQFINPLLECDLGREAIGSLKPRPSKARIETQIEDAEGRGAASHVSVYYRDLNNGPWMGIKEKETFAPASLLKVPLVMSFYKHAEQDPAVLSKQIPLTEAPEAMRQQFTPAVPLDRAVAYTTQELMERAIRYSDNDAAAALLAATDETRLRDLFRAMRLEPADGTDYAITVKDYAGFFRVLFNASYLTDDSSERMLETLTQTTFDLGLTAKLPKDLRVAHKFGERASLDPGTDKQLHDCGIVYIPTNPYLLCIMTRGTDMDQMAGVIADISKTVYDEVTAQQ